LVKLGLNPTEMPMVVTSTRLRSLLQAAEQASPLGVWLGLGLVAGLGLGVASGTLIAGIWLGIMLAAPGAFVGAICGAIADSATGRQRVAFKTIYSAYMRYGIDLVQLDGLAEGSPEHIRNAVRAVLDKFALDQGRGIGDT
jgi:hypothetical protein